MAFDDDIPVSPLLSLLHRKQTTFLNNKLKDVELGSGLYPLLVKSYKNKNRGCNHIKLRYYERYSGVVGIY